jgi:hypothetical protein
MTTHRGNRRLEKGLDDVGWGLLLLAFAALCLPAGTAEYAAVVVVGAGMIGLNLVRIAVGLAIGWFSALLGASGVLAGSVALAGGRIDGLVVFFALSGAVIIGAAAIRMVRPLPLA